MQQLKKKTLALVCWVLAIKINLFSWTKAEEQIAAVHGINDFDSDEEDMDEEDFDKEVGDDDEDWDEAYSLKLQKLAAEVSRWMQNLYQQPKLFPYPSNPQVKRTFLLSFNEVYADSAVFIFF